MRSMPMHSNVTSINSSRRKGTFGKACWLTSYHSEQEAHYRCSDAQPVKSGTKQITQMQPVFNQHKMRVGPRCIRAHQVTISFITRSLTPNPEQRVSSQGSSSGKSLVE